MKLFRRSRLPLVALVIGGCERPKTPPPSTDSAIRAQGTTAESLAKAAAAPSFDQGAGPVLLIAADVPTRAFVFVPDSSNPVAALSAIPKPASVTLFGRNGTVQSAELPEVINSGACLEATLNAAPPPRAWSVGFVGGVVAPVAMDSTESLTRVDSVTYTTGAIRLASALPNDSAGRFSGLPFVVRSVWRFAAPEGAQFIAATLMRQINQEATPLQERTLLIAQRSSSDSTLSTVYSERSYGAEETIETRDVIAAVMFGGRTLSIILSRDFGDAMAYAIIERGDDGRWRARWNSPRRRC